MSSVPKQRRSIMLCRSFALLMLLALVSSLAAAAELTVEKNDRGVVVKIDGQFFTEYLTHLGGQPLAKPILWPIHGTNGKSITRAYPMIPDAPGEERDHPHQRSFWFTHGEVNGIDFWGERASYKSLDGKK